MKDVWIWVGYISRYVRSWKDDRMCGYLVGILEDRWHNGRCRIIILGGVSGNGNDKESGLQNSMTYIKGDFR